MVRVGCGGFVWDRPAVFWCLDCALWLALGGCLCGLRLVFGYAVLRFGVSCFEGWVLGNL